MPPVKADARQRRFQLCNAEHVLRLRVFGYDELGIQLQDADLHTFAYYTGPLGPQEIT
jgi:hypothetical protein